MNLSFQTGNPSNSPPRMKKQGLKFVDEEDVHGIFRLRMSVDDIWFDGENFESFIDDGEKSVETMEKPNRLKGNISSSLGLEYHQTEEGCDLRETKRDHSRDMLLWEQDQQQNEVRWPSMQLAEASLRREASSDAEVRAFKLATQVSDETLKDCRKSGLLDLLEDGSTSSFVSLSDMEGAELDASSPRTMPVRVRFAEEPVVHKVIRRRSQISRQSLEGIWFGGEDFEAFVDEVDESVKKIEHGEQLKETEETSLGLEALTEGAGDRRHENQEDAWDTVLGEQDDQWKAGITSPFEISRAYRKVSREAVLNAIEQARKVSDEVQADKNCADDEMYLLKAPVVQQFS
ncbi:unnamed protein product [Cylindrotheca closterium]|uniref:Uncharacterized protein n=1 Tax=Cylindrotheca closterium TaxID=2856 RepID=A0AAD2PU92_9STRA|nr:unnamed protein product [Cylindrotheca closterium]